MSQEQARYELVTLEEASKRIDAIVEESIPFAAMTSANFSSTLKLAEAVATLREIFLKHPGIRKTVEAMQDTKLGFLTDRSPKAIAYAKSLNKTLVPYTYAEIAECCIEGMLKGYRISNNEFNVIAANFYAAKDGKYRKIIEHPDVTDFKFTTSSPLYSGDGKYAKVQCYASWLQKGQLVTVGISDKEHGKEDTLVFNVRVNAGMAEDAVVGKGLSKLFSRVLMRLTGKIMPEATDVEFTEVPALEAGSTLATNGDQPTPGAPIYDIKGGAPGQAEATAAVQASTEPVKEPQAPQAEAKKRGRPTKPPEPPAPEKPRVPDLVNFETGEVATDKKEEAPLDPFLTEVEEYRKEINDQKAWDLVLQISGVTHTGISSIPEGEPRNRFLERCSRTLDQHNAKKR